MSCLKNLNKFDSFFQPFSPKDNYLVTKFPFFKYFTGNRVSDVIRLPVPFCNLVRFEQLLSLCFKHAVVWFGGQSVSHGRAACLLAFPRARLTVP